MLFTLLTSYLYIRALWKNFDVEITCSETLLSAGASTDVLTKIKFDLPLPVPYVEIRSAAFTASKSGYSGYLGDTTWDKNIWIKNELRFHQRGIQSLDNIYIKVSDLFHIACFEKNMNTEVIIKVYPKIYRIVPFSLGGIDIYRENANLKSRSEDQHTIRDVRKYREGDSLKKVHWKLSAKKDELYVKNLDTISGEEFVLFVDMNRKNYSFDYTGIIEESIVDFSSSIVNQMIKNNLSIKVFLNTSPGRYFELSDNPDFNKFMDYLVSQKSDGVIELYQYIYENSFRLHRMNKIAIIVSELDARLVEAILQMSSSGYLISVFYCIDDRTQQEYSILLRNAQIECSHFNNYIKP
jgi:uncharacterized protein (DUF58 family)